MNNEEDILDQKCDVLHHRKAWSLCRRMADLFVQSECPTIPGKPLNNNARKQILRRKYKIFIIDNKSYFTPTFPPSHLPPPPLLNYHNVKSTTSPQ
jgi:hypothetical protein